METASDYLLEYINDSKCSDWMRKVIETFLQKSPDDHIVYMSTENSVNRSLKTRSLLTKFGTCSIAATGAVTTLLLFRSRFHCAVRFRGVCRNRLPYQSDKPCM